MWYVKNLLNRCKWFFTSILKNISNMYQGGRSFKIKTEQYLHAANVHITLAIYLFIYKQA